MGIGLPPLVLLAITTIIAMKVVGIILVVAMLVTPPATAALLTKRFTSMMLGGVIISIVGAIVGLFISYYMIVPSGAAIVLVDTFLFLAVAVGPRGLMKRGRQTGV